MLLPPFNILTLFFTTSRWLHRIWDRPLGAYFREFSNLSLIASQLENVGWGQIGVNFLFLLTVLRVNKFFSGFDILSISTSLLANYRADDS